MSLASSDIKKLEAQFVFFFARYSELYFYQMGCIRTIFSSAIIQKNVIKPPIYSLMWVEDSQLDDQSSSIVKFIDYISSSLEISKEKACDTLKKYAVFVKETLDKNQVYHIKRIASIRTIGDFRYTEYMDDQLFPSYKEILIPEKDILLTHPEGQQPRAPEIISPQKPGQVFNSENKSTKTRRLNKPPQQSVRPRGPSKNSRTYKRAKKKTRSKFYLYLTLAIVVTLLAILILLARMSLKDNQNVSSLGSLY